MKLRSLTLISILSLCTTCLTGAQQAEVNKEQRVTTDHSIIVPPAVAASAQSAVQQLGNQIKIGNFQYGFDTMYERYKKRQEALHGQKQLKAQVLGAKDKLMEMGVIIESFRAESPTGFFKVWPKIRPEVKAKRASGEQNKLKQGDEYYQWMVIVPTTQVWEFLSSKGGKSRFLKRQQFQIAVASELSVPGQEKWSFVNRNATIISPRWPA